MDMIRTGVEAEIMDMEFGAQDVLNETNRFLGTILGPTFDPARGVNQFDAKDLTADALEKKRGHTKDKLASWLADAVALIRGRCCPLANQLIELSNSLDDREDAEMKEVTKLKKEQLKFQQKFSELQADLCQSQKDIIRLQRELLAEKDRQLSGVATAVKSEMKSYADTVKKSCTESLAPRRIRAAIKTAADADERATNLVIYGLNEEEEEDTEAVALAVLENLGEKPVTQKSSRLGTKSDGKIRPILLELRSREVVREILAKAKKLKEVEGMRTVYISPDRSLEERKERKLVVDSRKERGSGGVRGGRNPD